MHNRVATAAAVAFILGSSSALADNISDRISIHGFGTAGFTHSTEDQADFTGRYSQPEGAGHSEKWGFGVDSRVGLQMDAKIFDPLTLVVQAITEKQYDNEFRPNIEWANLKYQITSDWSVRAGRVVAPTLMFSESSKVGYSYLWVRPPVELYRLVTFTNLDGVETSYHAHFGDVSATFQAEYGKTKIHVGTMGEITFSPMLLLNSTFAWDDYTFRLGYARIRTDKYGSGFAGAQDFVDMLYAAGLPGAASQMSLKPSVQHIFDVGGQYEGKHWSLAGEVMYQKPEDGGMTHQYVVGFLSAGYRLGQVVPYATFADSERIHTQHADTTGAAGNPAAPALLGAVDQSLSLSFFEQQSISIGARWDLKSNVAWKVQASHVMPGDNSLSTLVNQTAAAQRGHDYNVFSTTVDFVF